MFVCVCGVITWQEFHLLLLIGMSSSVAIISSLIVWKMEWKSWRERERKKSQIYRCGKYLYYCIRVELNETRKYCW